MRIDDMIIYVEAVIFWKGDNLKLRITRGKEGKVSGKERPLTEIEKAKIFNYVMRNG